MVKPGSGDGVAEFKTCRMRTARLLAHSRGKKQLGSHEVGRLMVQKFFGSLKSGSPW